MFAPSIKSRSGGRKSGSEVVRKGEPRTVVRRREKRGSFWDGEEGLWKDEEGK